MSNDINEKVEKAIDYVAEMLLMEASYHISNKLSINAYDENEEMLCEESAPNTDCGGECGTCNSNMCTTTFTPDAIDEALEQFKKVGDTMPKDKTYKVENVNITVACRECSHYATAMNTDPCNKCFGYSKWNPTTQAVKDAIDAISSNWPDERYSELRKALSLAISVMQRGIDK